MASRKWEWGLSERYNAREATIGGTVARPSWSAQHLIVPQRYLNFFSSVAFSACLLATWESAGGSLLSGLYNGGPAAIVYGIILSTIGNLAIACSLAELASLYVREPLHMGWC